MNKKLVTIIQKNRTPKEELLERFAMIPDTKIDKEEFDWNETKTRYNPKMTPEQEEESERIAQDLVDAKCHDYKYDKSIIH